MRGERAMYTHIAEGAGVVYVLAEGFMRCVAAVHGINVALFNSAVLASVMYKRFKDSLVTESNNCR